MMSLQRLSAKGRLRRLPPAASEIADLLRVVERDLAHHHTTIAALPLIVGVEHTTTADYLDACRSRRNTVDYDAIGIATEADVAELLREAEVLREAVLAWLESAHPGLV